MAMGVAPGSEPALADAGEVSPSLSLSRFARVPARRRRSQEALARAGNGSL